MKWVQTPIVGSIVKFVDRFRQDRRGALMVTYALILPFLLGVIGLGIESGIWYASKRNIQTQTDAAATAGAYERRRGNPAFTDVSAAALREALRNGYGSRRIRHGAPHVPALHLRNGGNRTFYVERTCAGLRGRTGVTLCFGQPFRVTRRGPELCGSPGHDRQ